MKLSVSVGAILFVLDVPDAFYPELSRLLVPFVPIAGGLPDATLSVVFSDRPFNLEGTVERANVFYREHGPEHFSLLSPSFELSVALTTKTAELSIRPFAAKDAGALIYNAFKWFLTYISIQYGGLPLHSSLVFQDCGATLFCGPSGSGKTTIARFLTSSRSHYIRGSDELNIVVPSPVGYEVFPTPFVSSGGACVTGRHAALRTIYFLKHDCRHRVLPISARQTVFNLVHNTFTIPANRLTTERIFDTATQLLPHIESAILYFAKHPSIAYFLEQERETIYENVCQP